MLPFITALAITLIFQDIAVTAIRFSVIFVIGRPMTRRFSAYLENSICVFWPALFAGQKINAALASFQKLWPLQHW